MHASEAWRRLCILVVLAWVLPTLAWASDLNSQWSVYLDATSSMQASDLVDDRVHWQADTKQGMNGYKSGVFWAQLTHS